MTIAEEIAEKYVKDMLCWKNREGICLPDECRSKRVSMKHCHHDGKSYDSYEFADGSVITVIGCRWGIGYRHCFCLRDTYHHTDCKNSHE